MNAPEITIENPTWDVFFEAWKNWKGGAVTFVLSYPLLKWVHRLRFEQMATRHEEQYLTGAKHAWSQHEEIRSTKQPKPENTYERNISTTSSRPSANTIFGQSWQS